MVLAHGVSGSKRAIDISCNNRAYILDSGTCAVNILDLWSEKLVAAVAVDGGPQGLAVNQATGKVFVSYVNHGGFVTMFPATTLRQQPGC